MPLYDYKCPAGHLTEARQGYGVSKIPCPLCGVEAERQAIYSCAISTESGKTYYSVSRYQEAAQEAAYYHRKMEEERGAPIPRRPLLNMAADQARQRGAKVKLLPEGV